MSLQEPRELGEEANVDLLHDESFPTASTVQREIQVSHRDRPITPSRPGLVPPALLPNVLLMHFFVSQL